MNTFFQAVAGVLLAIIFIMSIRGQGKDMGLLLSIFVCCAVGCIALTYVKPVIEFIQQLQQTATLDKGMLSILLKVVCISFVAEIAGLVCADAGNAAMGKVLQLLSVAVGVTAFVLFQVAAVLIFPLIWGIDGIWLSIVAAELVAALVTLLFLAGKRPRYRY